MLSQNRQLSAFWRRIVAPASETFVRGWLKCCFTSTETVGLLGSGVQDVHLDFDIAPELCRERNKVADVTGPTTVDRASLSPLREGIG